MDYSRALQLIKQFEGCELRAYPDPATGDKPWTIGYGTTRINGRPVAPGDTCTLQQAEAWLLADLQARYMALQGLLSRPISNAECCALLSFVYNVGMSNFAKSTMLKLLNNEAPKAEIALQFARWNRANGKVMNGLTRRRAAEAKLFLEPSVIA